MARLERAKIEIERKRNQVSISLSRLFNFDKYNISKIFL